MSTTRLPLDAVGRVGMFQDADGNPVAVELTSDGKIPVEAGIALGESMIVTGPLTDVQLRAQVLPVSLANGDDGTMGNIGDPPAPTDSDEDITARSGIGLLKGIKNVLRLIAQVNQDNSSVPGEPVGDSVVPIGGKDGTGNAAPIEIDDGQVKVKLPDVAGLKGGAKADKHLQVGGVDEQELSQTLSVTEDGHLNTVITGVKAAALQLDRNTYITLTCTLADTDYSGAVPAWASSVVILADNAVKVSFDAATTNTDGAGVGVPVGADVDRVIPITRSAAGDAEIHVQSSTAGTVVLVGFVA